MQEHFVTVTFVLFTVLFTFACSSEPIGSNSANTTVSTSPNPNAKATKDPIKSGFLSHLPTEFEQPADDVARRILNEYGAVFVAQGGAIPPTKVVFRDAAEVVEFQQRAGSVSQRIGGVSIELQSAAMVALNKAVVDATRDGSTITPRGLDAAKRSYEDTVKLWKSRVEPGLDHWEKQNRLSRSDAERILSLSPYEQVAEIFQLENKGLFFAKDLKKSIIYSVAPPGTSQHLSMLAIDISEFDNEKIREILARYGWFQTVVSDLPHFTYLGVSEAEITQLGLKLVVTNDRKFYVPEL